MKKWISLLLALFLLPLPAHVRGDEAAAELSVVIQNSSGKETDGEPLRDGSDETGLQLKKGTESSFFVLLPEEGTCASLQLRLSVEPIRAELQQQNEKKKWETTLSLEAPGVQFAMNARGITGRVRLLLSFSASVACSVLELRALTAGTVPESFHSWERAETVDILLVAETLESVDSAVLSALAEAGCSIGVAAMNVEGSLPAAWDSLWSAGLRYAPLLYQSRSKNPDPTAAMASWSRLLQPLLLVTDETLATHAPEAISRAADPSWNIEDAAINGIWAVSDTCSFAQQPLERAGNLPERSQEAILAWCTAQFETAQHADPALIPYPDNRQADGYLPEGEAEFVFEDEENGVWAYLSQTLQVEIFKYTMPEVPHTWFEANVIFRPEAESFGQHIYVNATFEGQQIYPETLAQTSQLVFAVNGDYYPNRADHKWPVGNIIRQRQVLYNYEPRRSLKFPNLDTLAIRDDGSFSVYAGEEITADDLLAQGDVHDALSFGPYLVRNGQLRVYNGSSADVPEPRCAYGMISPGHLFFVMVEGKMPKKGEQGFDLWQLAELMYARGCTEAMNVDGGSTAVMLFMGRKLNRTGKAKSLGSPRNQHELFGIGSSSLVHTDMADGKLK